jgi:hypothetical protein
MDSARIEAAAQFGLSAPTSNPYYESLVAFHRLSDQTKKLPPADIQAVWDLVAAHLEEARRARLEKAIEQARISKRKRLLKRLLEKLRTPLIAPRYIVDPPGSAADGAPDERLVLAESFGVDTDADFFRQRHQLYRNAQRQRTPVLYLVYRPGEPMTIERRVPVPRQNLIRGSEDAIRQSVGRPKLRAWFGSSVDWQRRIAGLTSHRSFAMTNAAGDCAPH